MYVAGHGENPCTKIRSIGWVVDAGPAECRRRDEGTAHTLLIDGKMASRVAGASIGMGGDRMPELWSSIGRIWGPLTTERAKRALSRAAEHKHRDYDAACEAVGVDFSPAVFDTWGGTHVGMPALWKSVVKKAVVGLIGKQRTDSVTALRRGLSLAAMRGVAEQLEVLLSTSPPLWVDGDDDILAGEIPLDEKKARSVAQ